LSTTPPKPIAKTAEQRRETNAVLGFVAVAVLAFIAAIAYGALFGDEPEPPSAELPGVVAYSYQGGMHTDDDVDYRENPPVGGAHHETWQNCGVYTEPVLDERAVHSMEHGAIWITYRPDLDPAMVAELTELAESMDYILLSPRPDGPSNPIVITAWNHQMGVETVDLDRIMPFIREFRKSPHAPEPGAPCTGGTSETAPTTT
jgi:hypothetical protein